MAYDPIGDIHGYADKMEGLLQAMGYTPAGRGYKAPQGRQAIFLGDLIDRGPQQMRVLEIARAMVESGDARCIMGNHEFNAIGYATDDPLNPGEALRPNRNNSEKARKNREQHAEFLNQVGAGSPEHKAWVEWFKTLPPFMDLGGMRVVHGCWDDAAVKTLMDAGWGVPDSAMSDELLVQIGRIVPADQESSLVKARKLLTCGMELDLPDGRFILDKSGHKHYEVRIANWRDGATELSQVALVPPGQEEQLQGMGWPADLEIKPIEGSPVFIGHHWFSGRPQIESRKMACLDWSAGKGGPLVAYRWDGEDDLSNEKLVWVGKD